MFPRLPSEHFEQLLQSVVDDSSTNMFSKMEMGWRRCQEHEHLEQKSDEMDIERRKEISVDHSHDDIKKQLN